LPPEAKSGPGCQRQHGRHKVRQECQEHQATIAECVCEERTQQNDDAEARQATASDLAQLGHRETVLFGPLAQNAAADGKSDASRKNCHETRPQQTLSVWCGGRCWYCHRADTSITGGKKLFQEMKSGGTAQNADRADQLC